MYVCMKVAKRRSKYRQLGKKAASHVLKTGATPSIAYGVGVYGATNSAIKKARSFACGAMGEMRGRFAFARLALACGPKDGH